MSEGAKRKLALTLEEWLRLKWAVERHIIQLLLEQRSYESILETFENGEGSDENGEGSETADIARTGAKHCEEEINLAKTLLERIKMAEILPREEKA